MKQYPSRIKFKKNHRLSFSATVLTEQKAFYPLSGLGCVRAANGGYLTFKQLEACRRSLRRKVRRSEDGKPGVWVRPFTFFSVTGKSVGMRMGSGKGGHSSWVSPVRAGKVICELQGNNLLRYQYIRYLRGASFKLPVRVCKIMLLRY